MKKIHRGNRFAIVAAAATVASFAISAGAATVTWTGAVDNDFGKTGNWDTSAIPGSGDDVVVAAPAATNLSPTLNAVARTIQSLTFNASPAPVNIVTDNTGRLQINGRTGDDVIVLGGSHVISSSDSAASPNVGLRHGNNFNFNIAPDATLEISARINQTSSGNSASLSGGGTLILSGNNGGSGGWNITGGLFSVNAGNLVLRNNGATGNSGNKFTINNGGVITLEANWGSANGNLTLNTGGILRTAIATRSINAGTGSVVIAGDATIDTPFALNMNQDISGSGNLTKTGGGTLHLNSPDNTHTGTINVAGGALNITPGANISSTRAITIQNGARLNVSELEPGGGYTVAVNQTVGGFGRVLGIVNTVAGATIAPGTVGAAGTLTIGDGGTTVSNLNLNGGRLHFDLANANTPGGGVNDLLVVDGNITAGAPTLLAVNRLQGSLTPGSYRLADYSGTLDPNIATNLVLPTVRQGLTLDTATAGQINLVVGSGAPASLVWAGDGVGNVWDTNGAQNWINGASPDAFFDWDDVSFTGAGSDSPSVNITEIVSPNAITVADAGKNYTFSGNGTISGANTLTKSGAGTLTLANADGNTFGTVAVNAGKLLINSANDITTLDVNAGGTAVFGPANPSAVGTVNVNSGGKLTFANNTPSAIGVVNVAAGGTAEIGDGVGGVGAAGPAIANAGTVVYNRPDDWTVTTVISGGGLVEKKGGGVAHVTAAQTYTGNTLISAGTIKAANSTSVGAVGVGTVTVADGATFDVGGVAGTAENTLNFGQKQFNITGNGVGNVGAIYNSGTLRQFNAFQRVALTGDASISGLDANSRIDIRAVAVNGVNQASLNLDGHTLTKNGPSQFTLVGVDVLGAGNIVVNNGIFSMETTTSVPAAAGSSITYNDGTQAWFFNTGTGPSPILRQMVINGNVTMGNASSAAQPSTVGSPIELRGNLTLGPANNNVGALTLTGNITEAGGPRNVIKSGTTTTGGNTTATLTGALGWTGSTTVSNGRLILANSLPGTSAVTVENDAVLEVAAGGGNNRVIKTGTVAITGTAKLDLTDNKLITTATPAGTATTVVGNTRVYDGLQGLVQKAKNGDAWDGSGLTSSKAATEGGLTTIGIANGAQAKGGIGENETALWGGQTITGSSILAMYTYAGDANLDGAITGDDYSAIDFGILFEGMDGYANGDFNYDGYVTGDDYSVIDLNILLQGPQIPTGGAVASSAGLAGVTAVPEPSACGFALLGAAMALRRRRRRAN